MKLEGTEQQIFSGLALADFFLSAQVIGAAVRRGDLQMADASSLFGEARKNLQKAAQDFPCDPVIKQIAEGALQLAEQMTAAYSAEKPPGGPH
jgi:hypothetical protein